VWNVCVCHVYRSMCVLYTGGGVCAWSVCCTVSCHVYRGVCIVLCGVLYVEVCVGCVVCRCVVCRCVVCGV
jgi:hypothetical protein